MTLKKRQSKKSSGILKTAFESRLVKAAFIQLLALPLLCGSQALAGLAKSGDLPAASLRIPPMVKEESLSTYIPSESAPGQGLAVNLIYTQLPRYKDGAPVLVVVPGGTRNQGLDFSMHSAQQGFVELRFAFPGGGKPGFMSSGIYDNRGVKCQEALRDVLRFASGELSDKQGKKINDLLPYRVNSNQIGAVGWSNGGNILLVTLGKYLESLPKLSWIAFYETAAGAMLQSGSLGSAQDMFINKHYRQGTAATGQVVVDFRKLRYQQNASKSPGLHKKNDEPEIEGVAFFDENENNVWEEGNEFAIPYNTDIGFDKQIYAPQVTKALFELPAFRQSKVVDKKAPPQLKIPVASYEESLAYFRERDGSLYIKKILQEKPELAITIFASKLDHFQRQPDHPHIALIYNAFLEQKPRFLRLNPSSIYVGHVAHMKANTFVENKPNSSIEADKIDQYLEPEGLIPDYAYMEAAAAELSDRVRLSKWSKVLEAPIADYTNGAKTAEEEQEALKAKLRPAGSPAAKPKETSTPDSDEWPDDVPATLPEANKNSSSAAKAGNEGSLKPAKAKPPEASSSKDWPFKK